MSRVIWAIVWTTYWMGAVVLLMLDLLNVGDVSMAWWQHILAIVPSAFLAILCTTSIEVFQDD